jgi:hypothetical protein
VDDPAAFSAATDTAYEMPALRPVMVQEVAEGPAVQVWGVCPLAVAVAV